MTLGHQLSKVYAFLLIILRLYDWLLVVLNDQEIRIAIEYVSE